MQRLREMGLVEAQSWCVDTQCRLIETSSFCVSILHLFHSSRSSNLNRSIKVDKLVLTLISVSGVASDATITSSLHETFPDGHVTSASKNTSQSPSPSDELSHPIVVYSM